MPLSLADQLAGLDITVSQSRFHQVLTNDPAGSKDVDVRDLNISHDRRELLTHADLHLQANTHYVLVGRNGSGKSTLLAALANVSIPGIPNSLRIVYIAQHGVPGQDDATTPDALSVKDRLLNSDSHRQQLLSDQKMLHDASEQAGNPFALLHAYRLLRVRDLKRQLRLQESIATYRSGARGFKARKDLVSQEKAVNQAESHVSETEDQIDAETLAAETSAAIDRLASVDAELSAIDGEAPEGRAIRILRGLGFTDAQINGPYANLSGGWRTRCSIASGLFRSSDILLLDEPTNFLDLPAIIWLKSYINSLESKTVVVVTHDRDFGDDISSTLLLLKDAAITVFHGTLSSYIRETRKQARHLTHLKEAQDKQEHQFKQQISHHVQTAKKSGDDKRLKQAASRKKRLEDRMGLTASAKGGRFKLNRDLAGYHLKARADIEVPQLDPPPKMVIGQPPDLSVIGNLVSFEGVAFHWKNAKKYTLHGVDLKVGPGDRVGVVGLNGAGKSTLVRLLCGPDVDTSEGLEPSKGTIQRTPRLRVGCFSQRSVEQLDECRGSALELVMKQALQTTGQAMPEPEARAVLGGLGLSGRIVSDIALPALSGGQKVRVALAAVLAVPPQLLVLDEVTCHLDADSVSALAKSLHGFQGAVVVVSHDRYFIRSVVENDEDRGDDAGDAADSDTSDDDQDEVDRRRSVLLVEKGTAKLLAGGIGEYEAMCEKRLRS